MKVLIFFFFVDKLNGNLPTITKTLSSDKVKFIILVKPLKYTVGEYLLFQTDLHYCRYISRRINIAYMIIFEVVMG